MVNKVKKGNYYRLRTRKFLEKEGYKVYVLENRQRIFTPKGIIFVARDIAGADLMGMNGKEIIFIQVKSNKVDSTKGIKELSAHPYPKNIKKWVVYWQPRSREPEITEL